jgi:nucleoside-diphosphate-sugar epimerase
MLLLVTGASGFVGSALLPELIAHGHTVLALARNEDQAARLESTEGVIAHIGSLDDLDSLAAGAKKADGVIHLAFKHDFENYIVRFASFPPTFLSFQQLTATLPSQANGKLDEQVTTTLAEALVGTNKPLIITSGTAVFAFDPAFAGQTATEDSDFSPYLHHLPRVASERILATYADKGVRTSVVRLPPSVHGDGDHGFVPTIIHLARKNGVSPYIDGASTFWLGVHVKDAAVVFRLAAEKAATGSVFHAIGDNDGLAFKDIATIVGDKLNVPINAVSAEQAEKHFGFFARFAAIENRASAEKTKEVLGWKPVQVTLEEDMRNGKYF